MPWGIQSDEPELIEKTLTEYGIKVFRKEVDLSQSDSWKHLFDELETHLGKVTILVNNATHSTASTPETLTAQILDDHYAVNVRASLMLSMEFAKRFSGKNGRIINLSSGQFQRPMLNEIAYAVTKGGVDAITVTLAAELGAQGITVNAVNPGPTDTGWMTPELEAQLKPRFPTQRIGQPEDAARLVGFLASEEAGWVTGQIIHSEGGFV
ncbi:UNVERIFIED_CONTAM: hypothetical protein GTU68_063695 [Idotea baltica]|nr:hypothetical protein [Idotea baltica]